MKKFKNVLMHVLLCVMVVLAGMLVGSVMCSCGYENPDIPKENVKPKMYTGLVMGAEVEEPKVGEPKMKVAMERSVKKRKARYRGPRFKKVRGVSFERPDNIMDFSTTVYEDTETGIKYLYIWNGAMSGGPAITRLWEKEDKK